MNWQALATLIVRLSQVAMDWYKLVNDDPNGERTAAKAASIVLDPDRPERDLGQVDPNGH